MLFDARGDIWVRQSWLETFMRCPERGRLASVKPEWDAATSDSALIGTGAHYGIEQIIRGMPPENIEELAANFVLAFDEQVKWTDYGSLAECADHAARCAGAWRDELMPHFNIEGARSEVTFKVPLYQHPTGRTVGITGTVDYVPNAPELGDWKTSKRKYKQRDKQRFAVQPSIYGIAAVKGGLQSEMVYEWPLRWRYGVMIRGVKKASTQIVELERTREHAAWTMHRIRQAVDMALSFGMDEHWPMIDEGNFLCSKTWCPWHSICRGNFLTADHDNWEPPAPTPVNFSTFVSEDDVDDAAQAA